MGGGISMSFTLRPSQTHVGRAGALFIIVLISSERDQG